tara:strand:- start:1432 stop:2202 length:771 start_codon:yes stop_codon:yes gene_type:complete
MRDFSLQAYESYLNLVKDTDLKIITFNELLSLSIFPDNFFVIRHDVDRKPKNALNMATLESEMSIKSTYYFRSKSHVFKPEIILSIRDLGHDIGYHYECLSDSKGDKEKALSNFKKNLEMFYSICSVKTISMHGRPLSPFNNLGMWEVNGTHKLIKEKFKLLGEINLDIDYSDIAYLNDTGRNWSSTKNNIRDHVKSNISLSINSSDELVNYLSEAPHRKIVFQIHPERWSQNSFDWWSQLATDKLANVVKHYISS